MGLGMSINCQYCTLLGAGMDELQSWHAKQTWRYPLCYIKHWDAFSWLRSPP